MEEQAKTAPKQAPHKQPNRFRRRWVVPVLLLFAVLALAIRYFQANRPHTTPVIHNYTYVQTVEGRGAFFFHEVVPDLGSLPAADQRLVEEGTRVRVDTPIFALDETMKKYVADLLKIRPAPSKDATQREQLERTTLEAALDRGQLNAPFSSVVSYHLDGYESFFREQDLAGLQPGDLRNAPAVSQPLEGVKFVENRRYTLAVDLAPTLLPQRWEVGKAYPLQCAERSFTGTLQEVRGTGKSGQLLLFEVREGPEHAPEERFVDVRIEQGRYSAFLIPTSAVRAAGGEFYCYVLDAKDIARKTQLTIIDSVAEFRQLVVRAWSPEERETMKERQLRDFDRVLLNPAGVKEGGMY